MNFLKPRQVVVSLLVGAMVLLTLTNLVATPAQGGPKKPAPSAPSPNPPEPVGEPTPTEPSPAPQGPGGGPTSTVNPPVNEAVSALAKTQTLIEFYFMETGSYPDTVEDMLNQYNQGVKQSDPQVSVPTDPATGSRLVYKPNEDRSAYTLGVPSPAAYGVASLEIRNVNWGWMAAVAADQKRKRQAYSCARYQEMLVSAINQYAKDHKNHFPDNLDELVTAKTDMKKIPMCPVAKKPYIYTHDGTRAFEVACPDPKAHGLEVFKFHSIDGPKRY